MVTKSKIHCRRISGKLLFQHPDRLFRQISAISKTEWVLISFIWWKTCSYSSGSIWWYVVYFFYSNITGGVSMPPVIIWLSHRIIYSFTRHSCPVALVSDSSIMFSFFCNISEHVGKHSGVGVGCFASDGSAVFAVCLRRPGGWQVLLRYAAG